MISNKTWLYVVIGAGVMLFSTIIIQVFTNIFSTKAVDTILNGFFMGFGSFAGVYLATHIKERVIEKNKNNKKENVDVEN